MSPRKLTVWLTGLSGSGKSTLARELLAQRLFAGEQVAVLDGDVLRAGLCKDLGFSTADRHENIRRVAEVARLMNDAGVTVICALISPLRADRQMARQIIGREAFVEVHVAASLEACERRDPKGLYKKARAGQIPMFTGIDSPYEEPESPDLVLDTDEQTLGDSVLRLLAVVQGRRSA
ncbi:adenylyl-sulfate kinase [Pelomonas sp. SE-A7]|uniref:adenylyl-sulfate kinase n=1 Tax=Pelomonas sp. SE-A7 TaxID=3054953 RepID=UPI00259C8A56|nr:adenylyl-sulfate kinase [Pelomonas sp. SE-A7]MDM4767550.1 adenylyl-sulfate kinase [Pelomonas sp. SE-A7]